VGAGGVGGWDDAGTLDEFDEVFIAAFEGEAQWSGLERGSREHFAAYFEDEIVLPENLLGGAGQRKTEHADPLDVHAQENTRGGSVLVAPAPGVGVCCTRVGRGTMCARKTCYSRTVVRVK